jgi:hypothetical protein
MPSKRPLAFSTAEQRALAEQVGVEMFRARHLELAVAQVQTDAGPIRATIDVAESPLAWLARRRGRDGRAMLEPVQFQAGEQLRSDFTTADLMPRITANWQAPVADGRRGASPGAYTDAVVEARRRVRQALDSVGPEFAGVLVDVCCFLKGLEQVESERGWPARSGKVVLQLGLDRLARHYGLSRVARGKARAELRTWLAEDAAFVIAIGDESSSR